MSAYGGLFASYAVAGGDDDGGGGDDDDGAHVSEGVWDPRALGEDPYCLGDDAEGGDAGDGGESNSTSDATGASRERRVSSTGTAPSSDGPAECGDVAAGGGDDGSAVNVHAGAPPRTAPERDFRGWLKKRGKVFNTSFKRRWFVLSFKTGSLSWYLSPDMEGGKPKGSLDTRDFRLTPAHKERADLFAFCLQAKDEKGRTYVFAAEDPTLYDLWVDAIQQARKSSGVAVPYTRPKIEKKKVVSSKRDKDASEMLTLIKKNKVGKVKAMLDDAATEHCVHWRAADGWRAIHVACYYDRDEILKLLLRYGADASAQTKAGETPLMLSQSYHPSGRCVLTLTQHFVNIDPMALPVIESVYENQRKDLMGKWSSSNLLRTDHPPWSDPLRPGKAKTREECELPRGWSWPHGWGTDATDADEDGWEYAVDFPRKLLDYQFGKKGMVSRVRRRRWVRTRYVDPDHIVWKKAADKKKAGTP